MRRATSTRAVFTLNATGALKLAGESYPFAEGGRCLLTFDNHNSVNGIREFARSNGAGVEYAPITVPDLRIDLDRLDALLDEADPRRANLLAFPAQSNFSGVKHPLDLIERARRKGWDVLLDAAAFVPTNRLDLIAVQPDFVTISFYKMFGYPTGVGCLIVRNAVLPKLKRPWFAGGTVNFATVQGRTHILAPREAGFEDGTLNYLSVPAVRDRAPPPGTDRHRDDPDTHRVSDRLAAARPPRSAALQRPSHGAHLRAGRHAHARVARSRSTSTIRTAACWITAAWRSSRARSESRSGPDASATPAPVKRPKGSRKATSWPGSKREPT